MAEHLASKEAMASFAILTVRPGSVSDRTPMGEIMDGDAVLNRLFQIAENGFLPAAPWLRASPKLLVATLQEHDPNFVHNRNGGRLHRSRPARRSQRDQQQRIARMDRVSKVRHGTHSIK